MKLERNDRIKFLVEKGHGVSKLATKFGLTRQRIYQILNPKNQIKDYKIVDGRMNCLICRKWIGCGNGGARNYCGKCVSLYKVGGMGRDLTRNYVRARDNNTCQVCGKRGAWGGKGVNGPKRLDVHHLKGLCGKLSRKYDKMESAYYLITVCHKCHYNLEDHRKYGKKTTK